MRGAVLFADITGFTALAEDLAQLGPTGAETLSEVLNEYFGRLIDLITAYGGDVVKFAGDALLAVWPEQDGLAGNQTRAVHAAARCALEVQRRLHNYDVQNRRLTLRVGVSAGEFRILHVGGVFSRWEFLLAGSPIIEVSLAQKAAEPGDVILSGAAWQSLSGVAGAQVVPMDGGFARLDNLADLSVQQAERIAPDALAADALRAYIPNAVLSRHKAGQAAYLSELRRVSVLFINLPDLLSASLEQAQALMRTLQDGIYRYEGSINKLNVDDKGITLVAALGLPPFAHEDDAARAVQAGLSIYQSLSEHGQPLSVGITTGRVFCGLVGNAVRQEYTVIGNSVNLSARLMTAVDLSQDSGRPLLCDETTYHAARSRIEFEKLLPVMVKGRPDPVAVYEPVSEKRRSSQASSQVIGRLSERSLLLELLSNLLQGRSGLAVIEGDAGLGKSRLVEDLGVQARALQARVLAGAGDAVEKHIAYHAWRGVFGSLMGLNPNADPEEQRRELATWMDAHPEFREESPLLNPLLPFALIDSDLTRQMTGQVRADNTQAYLARLLHWAATQTPLVIILEDAHWLDLTSWALLSHIQANVAPLLLVVASRPQAEPFAGYTSLLEIPETVYLPLGPMSNDDILALVCARLGTEKLPKAVSDLILSKGEGSPFFSEELAYALRDAGLLRVENGACSLAPGVDLDAVTFPDTVQGVVTSRIDRLNPQQQLALKVASVIGRIFALRTLRDVYPVADDREEIHSHLSVLERLDLTPLETPEPELQYIFKHVITQEVAYQLMLFTQRRELHESVARWYEETYPNDLSPFYALLAHHWEQAQNQERTTYYLGLAGEQALHNGTYQEASRFLARALSMHSLQPPARGQLPSAEHLRRAHLEQQLGLAHNATGLLDQGLEPLFRGLRLLGSPAPQGKAAMVRHLLIEIGRQAAHRLWPFWKPGQGQAAAVKVQIARLYATMGHIYYFSGETLGLVTALITEMNNLEAAGDYPNDLARTYSSFAVVTSAFTLQGLSDFYASRARIYLERADQAGIRGRTLVALSVPKLVVGQWEDADALLLEAESVLHKIGDRRQAGEASAVIGLLHLYQGNFEASFAGYDRSLQPALRSGDDQQVAWGLDAHAGIRAKQGRIDEAMALLVEAGEVNKRINDTTAHIIHAGWSALVMHHAGRHAESLKYAAEALELISRYTPSLFSLLDSYSAPTQVFLEAWEADGGVASSPNREPARKAVAALKRYAISFPVTQPRANLWSGVQAWLEGKHRRQALRLWEQALKLAQRYDMPYEEALILYERARRAGGPQAAADLATAAEVFSRLGAAYDEQQVRAALDKLANDKT